MYAFYRTALVGLDPDIKSCQTKCWRGYSTNAAGRSSVKSLAGNYLSRDKDLRSVANGLLRDASAFTSNDGGNSDVDGLGLRPAAQSQLGAALVQQVRSRTIFLASVLKGLATMCLLHFVITNILQDAALVQPTNICTCAYTKVAGIRGFYPCADGKLSSSSVQDLLGPHWHQGAILYVVIEVGWRFAWLVLRMSVLAALYLFAVQSNELERAVAQADKHAAALRSRLRFVSHECRVPLNSVVLGLECASEVTSDAQEAADLVRRRHAWPQPAHSVQLGRAGDPDSDQSSLQNSLETLHGMIPSMQTAAISMQATLDDVVCLEQIETRTMDIRKQPVQVDKTFLQAVANRLRVQALRSKIMMRCVDMLHFSTPGLATTEHQVEPNDSSADVVAAFAREQKSKIMVDSDKLQAALTTLISNAVHWSVRDAREDGGLPIRSLQGACSSVCIGCSEAPPHLWSD